jgi:hypothetical protein
MPQLPHTRSSFACARVRDLQSSISDMSGLARISLVSHTLLKIIEESACFNAVVVRSVEEWEGQGAAPRFKHHT